MTHDHLCSFTVSDHTALGRIVRLETVLQTALSQHPYPAWVKAELAELIVLATLTASLLKNKGFITMQVHSDGEIPLLVAEVTSEGKVRSYASVRPAASELETSEEELLVGANDNNPAIGSYMHWKRCYGKSALMAITIQQEHLVEPSQSTIKFEHKTLTEACRDYFVHSAQIATVLHSVIHADDEVSIAGGILLQCLPHQRNPQQTDDVWNTLTVLSHTLQANEMLDATLPLETILHRLFHNEGVALHATQSLCYACRCSRERAEAIFTSIPPEERIALAEEGKIEVTCGFCQKSEWFVVSS